MGMEHNDTTRAYWEASASVNFTTYEVVGSNLNSYRRQHMGLQHQTRGTRNVAVQ